jgi:hypothetical protein
LPIDQPSHWIASSGGAAFFSYSTNYLIETEHGVIMDVEATPAHLIAEVDSTRAMVERVEALFDLTPETDCVTCQLKAKCCPNTPNRQIDRSIHEAASDVLRRIAKTPEYLVCRCEWKR